MLYQRLLQQYKRVEFIWGAKYTWLKSQVSLEAYRVPTLLFFQHHQDRMFLFLGIIVVQMFSNEWINKIHILDFFFYLEKSTFWYPSFPSRGITLPFLPFSLHSQPYTVKTLLSGTHGEHTLLISRWAVYSTLLFCPTPYPGESVATKPHHSRRPMTTDPRPGGILPLSPSHNPKRKQWNTCPWVLLPSVN